MRLDAYLFKTGKYSSRNKASEGIRRGEVTLNGKIASKPSVEVDEKDEIIVNKINLFVSNGGRKLEKAIRDFALDVMGLSFADIGASTGGFTDCLLKCGASFVYAIDVGESQLSKELLTDKRIKVLDNFNARYLGEKALGGKVDGVVCDVSFISLTYLLKPIYDVLKDEGIATTLVKPQFECGRAALNKSGIVTDEKDRIFAVKKVYEFGKTIGLTPINFTYAPINEDKNVEYLFLWRKDNSKIIDFSEVESIIKGI